MNKQIINTMFLEVMDIIKLRNQINKKIQNIDITCKKHCIDRRILSILENEYARRYEDPFYKMKTIDEIINFIKECDEIQKEEEDSG